MKRNIAIVIGLVCLGSTSWAGLYQGGVSVSEAEATFTGEAYFNRVGIPTLNCTAYADIRFEEAANGVVVEVNSFELDNSLICTAIMGLNLPWIGFVPDAALPSDPSVSIPVSLSGIGINVCGSPYTVDVKFNNGGSLNSAINSVPSVLSMEEGELGTNCTLDFTLETELGEDVDIR